MAKAVYEVTIKTADRRYAGTDSNIFIRLHGTKAISDEIRLNPLTNVTNCFERNEKNKCKLSMDTDCGEIYRITVSSDCKYGGSDWCLDYIEVKKSDSESVWKFQYGGWIADTKKRDIDATS